MTGITEQQRNAYERLKKQNYRSKADERLCIYLKSKLRTGDFFTQKKQGYRKYKPIKESREWYFVEYYPPLNNYKFAFLQLVVLKECEKSEIVNAMEKEAENWLLRYPIPVLVSAFDVTGILISLSDVKPCDYLIGLQAQDGKINLYWKLLQDDDLPNIALDQDYLDFLYANLSYKTDTQLNFERQKRRRRIKTGWYLFFIWVLIIPTIFAIFEYFSDLLSLVVLIFTLYKAAQKSLELFGKWPKTKRQKDKEEEERLKNHYYYHCQMNPEGFTRLKQENIKRMLIEKTLKEAAELEKSAFENRSSV